jgi:hypothetical protein
MPKRFWAIDSNHERIGLNKQGHLFTINFFVSTKEFVRTETQ